MMADLPSHVRAEVQRVLDCAARRLLADQLDADATGSSASCDSDAGHDGADERTPLVEGKPVPVRPGLDEHGIGPVAA